jgi:HK97 family phage prohead protease
MSDITERATAKDWVNRAFTVDDIEIRSEGDGLTFDGVASVVDTPYSVRDMFGEFTETIVAGAFNRTLKQRDDVRLLVNHTGVPLARTKSKTLRLSASPDLRAIAPLDSANPTVQEIRSAMDRGDIDQMSIGMKVKDDLWNDDYTERTITELALCDVSIVTFPASETTTASLRSLDEAVRSLTRDDISEDELRRAITHLESLLPQEEREETATPSLDYLEHMQQLWAKRQVA